MVELWWSYDGGYSGVIVRLKWGYSGVMVELW